MYSDQELINMIKSGGEENDKAWKFIIKSWKNRLFQRVSILGAREDDFMDILNEIYESVVKRIRSEKLSQIENLPAFLSQCILYKWYKMVKINKSLNELELDERVINLIEDDDKLNSEQIDLNALSNLMTLLNKNCADILYMWSEGYKMEEIALRLSYKDATAMKKKKYKCLEQAKLIGQKLKYSVNE